MTYRLFPATYRYSLIRDTSGQWFVKTLVVDCNIVSLSALTVSLNSAINQLRKRPEIITSVECDHGVLLIPRINISKNTHTQEQMIYDLDGPIRWKSRNHAFIKIPCPYGAMCQWTRKPVARGKSNEIVIDPGPGLR